MKHHLRKKEGSYHPTVELLESRQPLAQFGVPWQDAQHLTVSFVPDGTLVGTQHSQLFQTLNATQPTAVWQQEILRAFQTWAVNAQINFALTPDGGQPLGVPGPDQGDPRFGDIRIGAVPLPADVLAVSVPHDPFLSGTWSGDILLNSTVAFDTNQANLFPVMLHEVGHVLGLDENSDPTSVMNAHENNTLTALSPADIAAVQNLYQPRTSDPFEGFAGNNTFSTAAPIPTPSGYDGTTPLLLYADISTPGNADIFSLHAPAGYSGPATIRVQTAGVSLLAPHLTVYDGAGKAVGDLSSGGDTGDTLQLTLPHVDPTTSYYVKIQGAAHDVFGVGEFALAVTFDTRSTVSADELDKVVRESYTYLSPEDLNAIFLNPQGALFNNDHHTNDTFATATHLEPAGAYGVDAPVRTTASLGDPTDVDFYQFETPSILSDSSSTSDGDAYATASDKHIVMTVTVRATEVNGIMPTVSVFDQNPHPEPAVVLAHGDGTYTIQVADARPETSYFVRVSSDPTSGKLVGNYELEVGFGEKVAQPTSFVSASLQGPTWQQSYVLDVNQTQLFDFLLAATAASPASTESVRMILTDQTGQVLVSRVAGIGETAGGDPVLLTPGVYRVTFTVEASSTGPRLPLTMRLYGASLSDPIGPALDDPTLKSAQLTTSALSVASSPLLGSSGDPYLWLAQSLAVPSGPGEQAAGALPAPTATVLQGGNRVQAAPLNPPLVLIPPQPLDPRNVAVAPVSQDLVHGLASTFVNSMGGRIPTVLFGTEIPLDVYLSHVDAALDAWSADLEAGASARHPRGQNTLDLDHAEIFPSRIPLAFLAHDPQVAEGTETREGWDGETAGQVSPSPSPIIPDLKPPDLKLSRQADGPPDGSIGRSEEVDVVSDITPDALIIWITVVVYTYSLSLAFPSRPACRRIESDWHRLSSIK